MHEVPSYRLFVGVDIAAVSFTACWTNASMLHERPISFAKRPTASVLFSSACLHSG